MPAPSFTNPPATPVRGDPTTFSARFGAFLAWLVTFVGELVTGVGWMNATAAAVDADATAAAGDAATASTAAGVALAAQGYLRRSTDNLAVGAGAKNLTGLNAPAAASFQNGDEVTLICADDVSVRQWGVASLANMAAGTMTVTVAAGNFAGAGPKANWIVVHRFFENLLGATAAEVLAAATALKGITPKAMRDALTPFALTDGSPIIGLSGLNGLDFTITFGANRTLPQLTNTYPGATGTISITQDVTGSRVLAVHSSWKRRGGLAVLSTTPGAVDELDYKVKAVDGAGNATYVRYDISRNPT